MTAKDFLKDAILATKHESFVEPEKADDLEALGILVSKYTEWTGEDIVKVFLAALEDSNFHELGEKIEELTDKYFETV